MKRIRAILAILALCLPLGCADWERTTFQTLSANKATLDKAHSDYESRKIPHTQCVDDLITKAIAVDSVADTAFKLYLVHKIAGTNLAEEQAAITSDLVEVAGLIVDVKALATAPCKGGK